MILRLAQLATGLSVINFGEFAARTKEISKFLDFSRLFGGDDGIVRRSSAKWCQKS
jgi:hypothetical protein